MWDEHGGAEDKGLYVKGRILGDDARKRRLHAAQGRSAISGHVHRLLRTRKWETDSDRRASVKLTEVELYEISPVTFPANEKAQVTRVKSEDGALMTERDFEEFLRDVGELSQKEAKIVVSSAATRHFAEAPGRWGGGAKGTG